MPWGKSGKSNSDLREMQEELTETEKLNRMFMDVERLSGGEKIMCNT